MKQYKVFYTVSLEPTSAILMEFDMDDEAIITDNDVIIIWTKAYSLYDALAKSSMIALNMIMERRLS